MIQFGIEFAVGLVALILVVTVGIYVVGKFVEWRAIRRELDEAHDTPSR